LHVSISLLGATLQNIICEHKWKSCCNFRSRNSIANKFTKDCCDSSLGNIDYRMRSCHECETHIAFDWSFTHKLSKIFDWSSTERSMEIFDWSSVGRSVEIFLKKKPWFPSSHGSLLSHNPTINWKCHCAPYRELIFKRGEKWLWVKCRCSKISF